MSKDILELRVENKIKNLTIKETIRQARIKDFRFNISIPYLSHNEISMIAKHDFKISDSDKLKDCKTVSREVFVNDIIEKLQKKIEILEKALEQISTLDIDLTKTTEKHKELIINNDVLKARKALRKAKELG